jgi:cyclopropane-fatty-acyl-phospholipid synthase
MKLQEHAAALITKPIFSLLLRRLQQGSLRLRFPDGAALTRTGDTSGTTATITIMKPGSVLRRVATGGGVGFAEAYLARDWETNDLAATLEVLGRNLDLYVRGHKPNRALAAARRSWQWATTRRNPEIESIDKHYNLGNEFYAAWLDSSMTYSSAVFTEDTKDLADAQREKYRRLADMAGLTAEDHVLEIGCGWGGFAEFAATEIGCHVTGLTLSTEQAEFARDRLKSAGVDDRTEIKLLDFRDETGQYDKIVSIEMIESIPAALWPPLFEMISRSIRPGGRVSMQAITIADDLYDSLLERDDFISKHIFPGGALPSVAKLRQLADANGLSITGVQAYASSYAATLRSWRDRFDQVWPRIQQPGFDAQFRRTWRYYLAYCEAGFDIGRIDVHQIGFTTSR